MPHPLSKTDASMAEVATMLQRAVAYCHAEDWGGYDPYDALNSRVFAKLAFLQSRVPRIALTQLLKRSPVNLRRVLDVPKKQNPKALSLFLSAFSKLVVAGYTDYIHYAGYLVDRIKLLRSTDQDYWCWGYSFPWQTRTVIVPSGTPNLVCTAFVAGALLDAYEWCGEEEYLEIASSAAKYIVDKLYWHDGNSVAGFAYPLPTVRNQVHNANFMAAALLCRVSRHTGETELMESALRATRFSASRQNSDGSWCYGEGPAQAFIDNFHTGFNLCALHTIMRELGGNEFIENVDSGFRFYQQHFYLPNGSVRYFHNRTFPIDVHAVAQSIITAIVLSDAEPSRIEAAVSVFRWAATHMWDRRGYFYYRVLRYGTIRIPYMRWSQAWMVFAISQLLCALTRPKRETSPEYSRVAQ